MNLSDYNPKARIFWSSLLAFNIFILGFAVFQLTSFSLRQFAVLGIALTVSAFANQHQIKIPKTSVHFSVKESIIFWAIIWLGLPGSVLIAASASLVRFDFAERNKVRWLFGGFVNVCSTFAAAVVFYLTLHYFSEFTLDAVAEEPIELQLLIAAASLMMLTHYFLSSILKSIFIYFKEEDSIKELWKNKVAGTAIIYVLSIGTAFLIHFLFLKFGLMFGLVILPITIVGHIAHRIHIKRLEQKTKEIVEASRVHLATVEVLATAIDARDQVGVGHVRRTQIYAVGMGKILRLSDDEIHALNTGALLHDIGKLAVPDHILNKPGRLTPAEMEKTKIHASVGAAILDKVNFSYPVVPTVKYHHECWDGSGYPEGLKGNDIPLTARILSVADAYDTLRGARPYRAAVSREEARKFIINGAGTQFDPKIVDIFLRNLKKFETNMEDEKLSYNQENQDSDVSFFHQDDRHSKSYVEQIKRANREVFTLYELARIFGSSLNMKETFSLFAEKIGELVPFDTCVIYLFDETESKATAVYAEGKNAAALLNRSLKPGEGATGYVLKKRLPVCNVNPGLDFSFCQLEFVQEYSAMASLPLIADEKMLGAVSLYSCVLENYEDEHLRLLETVSRIASDAISKSIYHAETETKALTDPMTALPNARSLQIQFEKEVARADRNGSRFQVLMLDLDGFKAVNDTFGHKVGDKLLRELSKVMRGQLRDYDFLARYAGDEFVAIIPETDKISVDELCQRIEKSVNDFILPVGDGKFARVGISIGAAAYPTSGGTIDQIVIAADKAMYSVKARRKQVKEEELKKEELKKEELKKEELKKEELKKSESEQQKQQSLQKVPEAPKPIQIRPIEPTILNNEDLIVDANSETFVVELDESHIISSAIN
jgi:diguanylate cyclase (GGDEF)-like protein/putative nucleotidyltransferase with HDIG domain